MFQWSTIARFVFAGAIVAGLGASLAGGARGQARAATLAPHPAATQLILPTTVGGAPNLDTSGNNWPGFRANDQHTGYNPYQTTITKANVATLKPKWTNFTYPVAGEMTVVDGIAYEADGGGYVRAWNLATGAIVWTWHTPVKGDAFYGAPVYYHGTLYLGSTGVVELAAVYALNAKTGVQEFKWVSPNTEFSFQGSTLVANGLVYVGNAGFDEDTHICDTYDNLVVLSAFSGTQVAGLNLIPNSTQVGADIWSAPVLDLSGNVYVGTGNSCSVLPLTYEDSVIRLRPVQSSPELGVSWIFKSPYATVGNDMDFGASHIFVNGMVIASGKDGFVYAFNAQTGAVIWRTETGEVVGTPATDGVRLYVPVNWRSANGSNGTCMVGAVCGAFTALNLSNGKVVWARATHEDQPAASNFSPPAISQGIVFTAYDKKFWALDAVTGSVLWSYAAQGEVWAGLSVVNGCLLGAEVTNYHAYCFSPNGK